MERKKKNLLELTRITCEDYRALEKLPVVLACDNVRSMMNVGSLLRTCDAFLIGEVLLGGITGCPPHPEIAKTALGADRSVRWRHVDDLYAELRRFKEEGWRIAALEQTHNSVPLQEFIPACDERYVLVVGNEVQGVDQRIVDLADTALEIPQCGTKHSLNVSVSGGIALWHFFSNINNYKDT